MTNLIGISGQSGSGKDLIASIIQYLIWRRDVEMNRRDYMSLTLNSFINNNNLGKAMSGFKVVKYADKLKDIICLLTGCTRADLEYQEFKKSELPEIWHKWELHISTGDETWTECYSSEKEALIRKEEREDDYYVSNPILFKPTYRYLLTKIGTDLFRYQFHPDTWVNATFADYKKVDQKVPGNMSISELLRPVYPQWIISDVRFPNELKAIKDRGGICIRVLRPLPRLPIEPDPHISESALDNSDDFDYMVINDGTIDDLVEKVKEILVKENVI